MVKAYWRTWNAMRDRSLRMSPGWRLLALYSYANERTRHRRQIYACRPDIYARIVIRLKRKSRSKRVH